MFIKLDRFLVEVKIVDRRSVYGRTEMLVVPVAGSGENWVREDKILKPADLKKIVKKPIK